MEWRVALKKLGGWREDLATLTSNFRCGQCGGKEISYKIVRPG
jgi:hypothetical protein